jgi:RNA polymerase sigma-70 factor (ECF subfamily)
MSASPETGLLLEHLFRHQAGRMVARLARLLGPAHLDLAEESVQQAMLRALQSWPYQGLPENPAAWLFRVAHNAAIDAVRRTRTFHDKTDAIVEDLSQSARLMPDDSGADRRVRDDELRMIFMCCHPEISRDASVALSLKTVGGFSVREIARAFLMDDTAIAQRLVRAKRQIRDKQLTLQVPIGSDLRRRLDSVLDVIYLMFNEGYAANDGQNLIRQDLCLEALRLGRLVASAISEPRVHALVALMALQAARFAARVDAAGDLILLENQDRGRWDQELIRLGFHHFDRSIAGDEVSEYHAQAAIAATHARAVSAQSTDWPMILRLYDQLLSINGSAVVALNRAVAVAKVRGPSEGLAAVEPLENDVQLRDYYLFLALRGHLLSELGRAADAADSFRAALECPCSEPERRFLKRKLEECDPPRRH